MTKLSCISPRWYWLVGIAIWNVPLSSKAAPTKAPNSNNRAEYLASVVGNTKLPPLGREWGWEHSKDLPPAQRLIYLRKVAALGPLSQGAITADTTPFLFTEDYVTQAMKELLNLGDKASLLTIQQRMPALALDNQEDVLQTMLYRELFDPQQVYVSLAQTTLRQVIGKAPAKSPSKQELILGTSAGEAALVLANSRIISVQQTEESRALIRSAVQRFPTAPLWFAATLTHALTEGELLSARKIFANPSTIPWVKAYLNKNVPLSEADTEARAFIEEEVDQDVKEPTALALSSANEEAA